MPSGLCNVPQKKPKRNGCHPLSFHKAVHFDIFERHKYFLKLPRRARFEGAGGALSIAERKCHTQSP